MKFFERPATWFVLIAVLFELALAALATGVGQIFQFWPLIGMASSDDSVLSPPVAVGIGLIATAPMTLALAWVVTSRWSLLRDLGDQAEKLLAPFLAGAWQFELLLVALAAGIGEEILFRGLVQEGLARWWTFKGGWALAWVLSAIVFGVCHWINRTYALLATFAGLYLGWLLIVTDNLLVPITAHAMYDLAALVYLAGQARRSGVADEW